MTFYTFFSTAQIEQLTSQVLDQSGTDDRDQLELLLNASVLTTLAKTLPSGQKTTALQLIRSEPNRLVQWLTTVSPTSKLAVTEALTRVLLSLRLE